MREIKPELVDANEHKLAILQYIPHQGLVKANRLLLILLFSLMTVIFLLGFFFLPADKMLDDFSERSGNTPIIYTVQNPVLSSEINILKGQLVGLISGSIESKLRTLEASIREGSVKSSLGTLHDLRNDVKVLQTYSAPSPIKAQIKNQIDDKLLKEVSQLKSLIYLTLTSCGLMIAAIGGFWIRNQYRLTHTSTVHRATLGRHK